jgi:glycerol-3-phosphate dehydrogenase
MDDLLKILSEVHPLVGFGILYAGVAAVTVGALIWRRRPAADAIDEVIAKYNGEDPSKQTLKYTIPLYQAVTNNAWWLHKEDMARCDEFLDTIESRFAGTELEQVYNFRRRQKEKARSERKAAAAEEIVIRKEVRRQETEHIYRDSLYSRLER